MRLPRFRLRTLMVAVGAVAPTLATLACVLAGVAVDRSGFGLARPLLALFLVSVGALSSGVLAASLLAYHVAGDSKAGFALIVAAEIVPIYLVWSNAHAYFVTSWK